MYYFDTMSYDPRNQTAYLSGKVVRLPSMESSLLVFFIENANTVLSRDILIRHLWGDSLHYRTRVVDVYVSHLRKKLCLQNELITVHQCGYMLSM